MVWYKNHRLLSEKNENADFLAGILIRSNLLTIKAFWLKLGGLDRLCVKYIHINFHMI